MYGMGRDGRAWWEPDPLDPDDENEFEDEGVFDPPEYEDDDEDEDEDEDEDDIEWDD